MKVEDAIAMLQALPPGSDVDLTIRSIVTPSEPSKPGRRRPGRWANTTPEQRRAAALKASEARWSRAPDDASLTDGDASSDASVTDDDASGLEGGNQGGSDLEEGGKSGKERENPDSDLTGRDRPEPGGDRPMRQVTHASDALSHDASPRRRRSVPKQPTTALPEHFPLTDDHREYAASKSWPAWWLENRHEQFCSLAVAKSWRYVDWTQALYTYLRNEIGYQRGPEHLAHLAPKNGSESAHQPVLERQKLARAERHERVARELEARGQPVQKNLALLKTGIGDG